MMLAPCWAAACMAALDAARLDPDIAEVAAQLVRQREIMAAWLVDQWPGESFQDLLTVI
jgi:hypothetical protein